MIARGTVIVERPARVALRYTDPDARVILIDGDRMTISWPSANLRSVKDIGASQRRIQKYFVDSSPDELRRHFEVSASEAPAGPANNDHPGAYLITMVPKRKQILEGMTRLELWLDRTSLLLAAMRMTFPTGDTKLMTFTDVKPNAAIDAAWFKISARDRGRQSDFTARPIGAITSPNEPSEQFRLSRDSRSTHDGHDDAMNTMKPLVSCHRAFVPSWSSCRSRRP